VTERVANQIVVFPVQADGTTGTPVANNSHGNTPFSEAFTPAGVLVVVEAAGRASRRCSFLLFNRGRWNTPTD
jgi:hypothetical protein